jgi:G:T/U-mismatch repair DNA glycosylase
MLATSLHYVSDGAAFFRNRHPSNPVWEIVGDLLLSEAISVNPIRETLHHQRTIADVLEHDRASAPVALD